MTERIRLSHAYLDGLQQPSKRVPVYDLLQPGLMLWHYPTGRKVFYWYGRIGGSPSRIQIGPYPQVSVEAARNDAKRITGDVASGAAPRSRRQRAKSEWTLGRVFDHFLKFYAVPHKRTWKRDERRFARTLADWRHKPIAGITKAELKEKHVAISEQAGIYAANDTLQFLSSLFNYAIQQLGWKGDNPTRGITRFAERERDRFLTADELPRFFLGVLSVKRETTRDFFLLCLFTGARRNNVAAMRYADIDMERCEWRIPGEESKSGDPMVIALTPFAMAIVKRRKKTADGQWVLPGHGSSGHFMWPREAWRQLLATAGIENLRIHDLRRTLGSWQAMTGSSLLLIAKSLGHTSTAATKIYARLQMAPVRQSVDIATGAMMAGALRDPDLSKKLESILGDISSVLGE